MVLHFKIHCLRADFRFLRVRSFPYIQPFTNHTLKHKKQQQTGAKRIHVIASMDHINGPLIWSQRVKESFNWLWHDVTTWQNFFHEAAFEAGSQGSSGSLLSGKSRGRSKGIKHVLESVTSNHRDVWKLLGSLQLQHLDKLEKEKKQANATNAFGITFQKFYQLCVGQMFVRDDRNLKTLLRELMDHAIVATRNGEDGNTVYEIPHPPAVIKHHLREMKKVTNGKKKNEDFSA